MSGFGQAEAPFRAGWLVGSSLLRGHVPSSVLIIVGISLPLASSCRWGFLDLGGVGWGGKRVEGARGIFCFLAKGNFSLPWEGTCIYCSNLSWSCILPSLLGHNFLFERSCLSKRGSAPSHQLLLRVELKAADPVAAEESCVSWDLCGVSERAYGAVSTLHTSLSPQPQPPHSLPYSSS